MDLKALTLFAVCLSLLAFSSGCSSTGGAGNVSASDIQEARIVEEGLRVTSMTDGKYFVTPGAGLTTVTFTEPAIPEEPDNLRQSIILMRQHIANSLGIQEANKIRFVFPQMTIEE